MASATPRMHGFSHTMHAWPRTPPRRRLGTLPPALGPKNILRARQAVCHRRWGPGYPRAGPAHTHACTHVHTHTHTHTHTHACPAHHWTINLL